MARRTMTKSPPSADKTITVKEVGVIAGVSIYEFLKPVLRLQWDAGMTIDCDGSGGNPDNDPYFQPETSLKYKGKSLNAYEVPFIVVPPFVIGCVKPVVMGCMAVVINLEKGEVTQAVVGDCGPQKKIGEASCACAEEIGLDGDPNHGGTEKKIIRYMIFPGIAAYVDGKQYELQPS
jgi:Fungal chitosanase of glycosyl hydrolase group 75